jgi:energy-converting hydrogenase Eha subunit E
MLILRNIEFLYNNSVHAIIGVSLFFALYNYHLNVRLFIKKEVLKSNILIAREKGEKIVIIHKMLSKQLLIISEY